MITKVTFAIVLLLLVAATSVAGCPNLQQSTPTPTSSPFTQVTPVPTVLATPIPTPTPTPGPNDAIKFFTGWLEQQQYVIRQPLGHGINSIGNDVYRGTVARGTMTATVEIQTYQTIYDTQQGALTYKNNFIGQGYVQREDTPTSWYGTKSTGEAWMTVNTKDLYVVVFWY
jgi:hypothetical protein